MKLSLYWLIFTIFGVSFDFKAQASDDIGTEYSNMEQMMGSIRLEKKQIESMVDKMVSSGRISPEEGSKAKREIASVKENDIEEFKSKIIVELKNNKSLNK